MTSLQEKLVQPAARVQEPSQRTLRTLVLTSSFPRHPQDVSAPYLLELSAYLKGSGRGTVEVLLPADPETRATTEPSSDIRLHRFRYCLAKRWQTLAFGSGIPDNLLRRPLRLFHIPFFLLSFYRKAAELAKDFDLIHAHWALPAGWIGALLKRRYPRLRYVVTVHSSDLWLLERLPLGRTLFRQILNEADCLTLVSQDLEKRLARFLPDAFHTHRKKIRVLSMGIHWDRYQPDGSKALKKKELGLGEGKVILYLGRLIPLKGVADLVAAVPSIPGVQLLVLGDGVEREKLEALSQGSPHIRFLGNVQGPKKLNYLKAADIAVFPSLSSRGRTEGLPVALLEAMASGLAVIATDTGGMKEVIQHGQNGLLTQPGDVARLRKTLEFLLGDESYCLGLGEAAHRTSCRFDWSVIGGSFLRIYNDVVCR